MRITVIRNGKPARIRVASKFMITNSKMAWKSPLEYMKWIEDLPEEKQKLLEEIAEACEKGFNSKLVVPVEEQNSIVRQLRKEYQETFGKESGEVMVGFLKMKDEDGIWKTEEVFV